MSRNTTVVPLLVCAALALSPICTVTFAGDLTTDNLTVRQKAVLYGDLQVMRLAPVMPTNGLVLAYSFAPNREERTFVRNREERTVTDVSGNGNTGLCRGRPTWNAGGIAGQCISLDGTDDYVQVATAVDLVSNFTICAWIRHAGAVSGSRPIFSKSDQRDQSTRSIEFGLGNDTVSAYFWNSDTQFFAGTSDPLPVYDGAWHLLVLQHDSSLASHQMRFYFDGAPMNLGFGYETTDSIPAVRVVSTPWMVGTVVHNPGLGWYFHGDMDEVSLYNRVLTASEVKALYDLEFPTSSANTVQFGVPVTISNNLTVAGSISGAGSNLTNLNASALATGTIPLARLSGITSNQIAAATDAAYRNTADLTARAAASNAQVRANLSVTNGGLVINGNIMTNGAHVNLTAAQVGAVTAVQASNIVQNVIIRYVPAVGDISMGPFTNRP